MSIAAGYSHTCAVIVGGTVKCWGRNQHGQLGTGNTMDSNIPKATAALGGGVQAISVSAGDFHTCAVVTGNKARCWGRDVDGQVGSNYIGNSNRNTQWRGTGPSDYPGYVFPRIPTIVWRDYYPFNTRIELDMVASISPGENHTCSLKNAQVWCWGGAWRGQLGVNMIGPRSSAGSSTQLRDESGRTDPITRPVLYNGGTLNNIKGVSSGNEHSCALSNDDRVWCWGRNDSFRLGLPTLGNPGSVDNRYPIATQVPFPSN